MGGMEATVLTLLSISSLLVPIIAIMLGYGTIAGEAESGALSIVLAYPVRRGEVLMGKFLGLSGVISFSIVLGFGTSGVIIGALGGDVRVLGYILFILYTILLGLLYLSTSMLFSTLLKRKTSALGAGIFLFFWGMIVGMIFLGIYFSQGHSMEELFQMSDLPSWFWLEPILSPQDGNQMAVMLAFGKKELMGFKVEPPSWLNLTTIGAVQLTWTVVALVLSFIFFNRRDI